MTNNVDDKTLESLKHSVEEARHLSEGLKTIKENDQKQDYTINKMTSTLDLHSTKLNSLEEELKDSVDELKGEIKSNQENITIELNKLAESEQEYKDSMNNQVKQILFSIIGVIISIVVSRAFTGG